MGIMKNILSEEKVAAIVDDLKQRKRYTLQGIADAHDVSFRQVKGIASGRHYMFYKCMQEFRPWKARNPVRGPQTIDPPEGGDIMAAELIDGQPKERSLSQDESDFQSRLKPLLENKAVALTVRDEKMFPKKRISTPVLFLQPGECFEHADMGSLLVVSLWGFGCDVLDTREEIRAINFYRIGVSAKIAKLLAGALGTLYSSRRV